MSQLNAAINQIAQKFANEIANAIKQASFADVAAMNGAVTTTTASPRTTGSHTVTTARVHALLSKHGSEGLRSENIREHFGLDKVAMAKTLKKAMAEGIISKTGEKRATVYFARRTIDHEGAAIENPAAVLAAAPEPTPQQRVIRRPGKAKKKSSTVVIP